MMTIVQCQRYLKCFVTKKYYSSVFNMEQFNCKKQLCEIFLQSIAAVNPAKLVAENLKINEDVLHVCEKVYPLHGKNVYLVGFGKAVLGMASQCEKILVDHLKEGVICIPEKSQNTNREFALKPNSVIKIYEGAKNNLPDKNAEEGAEAIVELIKSLHDTQDILMVLISGGGSALLPKPKPGISLAEKLKTITMLASSGASIVELNTVRKKLSQVKGGGLASMAYPTRMICLILSDVIDDPLDVIASGPTVLNLDEDDTALKIVQKYNLEPCIPIKVLFVLKVRRYNVPVVENSFLHVDNFVIGNNSKLLNSAKQIADDFGFKSIILSNEVCGLVEDVAFFYKHLLFDCINCIQNNGNSDFLKCQRILYHNCCFGCEETFFDDLICMIRSNARKICILAGGEPTVKVVGKGKGGRNQELTLLMSLEICELKRMYPCFFEKYDVMFLSAGTDGIDGPTDAAGAIGEANVIEEALKNNLNVHNFLSTNDSNSFFEAVCNGSYLIKTGHTGTNVMDIHMLVICEKEEIYL